MRSYPKNRLNLVALYDKQEEDLFCLEFVKCIMKNYFITKDIALMTNPFIPLKTVI